MSEGVDEDLLVVAGTVLKLLAQRGWCLGTAESITGGMVGETITAVPAELLEECGAVSAEVVEAMAQGCRERLNVQVGLATTGVAGPASDDRATPVGTVFVACATPRACAVEGLMLDGDRRHIRVEATRAALRLAIRLIETTPPGAEETT